MPKQSRPVPRGIRNNNPLNIRIGNVWLGEVNNPTDREFEQFVHMTYGIRAACVLIRRYINHYKLTTPKDIISRWAPRSENDTSNYVRIACGHSQLSPDTPISYTDKPTVCRLLAGMIQVECGQPIDPAIIEQGYDMA